jgi:GNAT superfamily N-acetyltransferase
MSQRNVRELSGDELSLALPALLLLRPQFSDEASLRAAVERQMGSGYRLLAAFVPHEPRAVAVAGFRVTEFLAWGRVLYVDDLSTLVEHRGAGHARALMQRLSEIALEEGCDEVHLDSGVGEHRAAAHTLYQRSGLHVSALHFRRDVREA